MSDEAAVIIRRPFAIEQSNLYVPSAIEDLREATLTVEPEVPSITEIAPAAVVPIVIACNIPLPVNIWVVVFVEMYVGS